MAGNTIHGQRDGAPRPISSVDDSGTERLAVDAEISAIIAGGVDQADDSILVYGNDGTTNRKLKTDTAGELQVDVLTMPTQASAGDVAHDGVDSGNPIKIGGKATADAVTPPTAVAANDRVNAWFDAIGRQVTVAQGAQAHDAANDADNHPLKQGFVAVPHGATPTAVAESDIVQWHANRQGVPFVMGGVPNVQTSQYVSTGAITDDNLLPAIGAGAKYVVTRVSVTLDEATTVGVAFRMGFGASVVPAAPATNADAVAGILLTHPGLVPGGGVTVGDGSGILGVGGDGEELRFTCEAPTSGAIHATVSWYSVAS